MTTNEWLHLVDILNRWPLAFLIAVTLLLFVAKTQIKELIERLKKAGPAEFHQKPQDTQVSNKATSNSAEDLDDMLKIGDSDLIDEVVQNISAELDEKVGNDPEKVSILKRRLAASQIFLEYEQIHAWIYGSQIELLKTLNRLRPNGMSSDEIDAHFDIEQLKDERLKNSSAKVYMEFLLAQTLVLFQEDKYAITVKGVDYLLWVTREAKYHKI